VVFGRIGIIIISKHMNTQNEMMPSPGAVSFSRVDDETLLVRLKGVWKIGKELPSGDEVMDNAALWPAIHLITFDYSGLDAWDSSLLAFIVHVQNRCSLTGIKLAIEGLPQGIVRLLKLASEFKELESLPDKRAQVSFLASIGERTFSSVRYFSSVLEFIGEAFVAFLKLLTGSARYRGSDMGLFVYECGPQALPIVSLISVLVGLILGFVGVVQLKIFGAQIYIANLVGIGMAREMGAMMTAIIMMGRTGAAFATQLGTMEAGEEIDALKTLGISPMEFLVMPRMLALILMMPLLCVYADIVGIMGGAFVGVGMYDISLSQYFEQTRSVLNLTHFSIGVIKSIAFAILIAISGCFHGMRADRSASAVGYAATRAVVTGIVLIVVTDGIFAVITSVLGI
jgi:phospholipid/cholesterol/gamma-HCH transport system permease protein